MNESPPNPTSRSSDEGREHNTYISKPSEEVMTVLHDAAKLEDEFRKIGATAERIKSNQKIYTIKLAKLAVKGVDISATFQEKPIIEEPSGLTEWAKGVYDDSWSEDSESRELDARERQFKD